MENIFLQYQKPKLEEKLRMAKQTDLLVMHGIKENAIRGRIATIGTFQTAFIGIMTSRGTNA